MDFIYLLYFSFICLSSTYFFSFHLFQEAMCCNVIYRPYKYILPTSGSNWTQAIENKEVLAIEYKKTTEVQEERPPSPSPSPPPPPPSEPVKVEAPPVQPPPDLLVTNFFLCAYLPCFLYNSDWWLVLLVMLLLH